MFLRNLRSESLAGNKCTGHALCLPGANNSLFAAQAAASPLLNRGAGFPLPGSAPSANMETLLERTRFPLPGSAPPWRLCFAYPLLQAKFQAGCGCNLDRSPPGQSLLTLESVINRPLRSAPAWAELTPAQASGLGFAGGRPYRKSKYIREPGPPVKFISPVQSGLKSAKSKISFGKNTCFFDISPKNFLCFPNAAQVYGKRKSFTGPDFARPLA